MKHIKKGISLLLSIIMFTSGFPVTLFAQEMNATDDSILMYEDYNSEIGEIFDSIESDTDASIVDGFTQEQIIDNETLTSVSSDDTEEELWFIESDTEVDDANIDLGTYEAILEPDADEMIIEPYMEKEAENGINAIAVDELSNETIQLNDVILTDDPEMNGDSIPTYNEGVDDRSLNLKVNKRTSDGVLIGDVNKDDVVTKTDLTVLSRYLAKWESYENAIVSAEAADIDGDYEITAKDRLILARYLNGWSEYEKYFVVEEEIEIEPPTITSISEDGFGKVTVSWTSVDDAIIYYLFEQMSDGTLKLITTTEENTAEITVIKSGEHSYAVSAMCDIDDVGRETTEVSDTRTINVHMIWVSGIAITSIAQTAVDKVKISWTSISPIDAYSVYQIIDGAYVEVANGILDSEYTFESITAGRKEYSVRGSYMDKDGVQWRTPYSGSRIIDVLDSNSFKPDAPVLIFNNGEEFSTDDSNVPTFKIQDFLLKWNECEGADSYGLSLEKKQDENNANFFVNVFETEIRNPKAESLNVVDEINVVREGDEYYYVNGEELSGTSVTLTEKIFEGIETETEYKVSLWSNGEIRSDDNEYYFSVQPFDATVYINGKTAFQWDRTNSIASTRIFEITSELPWTATSDVDWLTIIPENNTLEVRLNENVNRLDYRTATITLSNGLNEAILTVNQGSFSTRYAPTMTYKDEELSTDIDNPTIITAGGFEVELNDRTANRTLIKVWEVLDNGNLSNYIYIFTGSQFYRFTYKWGSVVFDAGKKFKIEISGHYSKTLKETNENETSDDTVKQVYYIEMTDEGKYIDINGNESQNIVTYYAKHHYDAGEIHSSNICTVESDSDWLECELDEYGEGKQYLDLYLSENTGSSNRTGHVTVYCGTLSVVITVTQETKADSYPRIITPTGMSENENSPTSITTPTLYVNVIGSLKLEKKTSSGYEDAGWDRCTGDVVFVGLTKNEIYRITLTEDDTTRYYYFTLTKSSTYDLTVLGGHSGSYMNEVRASSTSAKTEIPFKINADYSWKAESDVSWMKLSKTSGSKGTGIAVTATVEENTTGVTREGIVRFMISSSVYAVVRVVQSGRDDFQIYYKGYRFDTTIGVQHLSGGKQDLKFMSLGHDGADVTCLSNANWITVKDSNDSYDCRFEISKNTSGTRREGTVTIKSGNHVVSIPVSQEPYLETPTITVPTLSTDKKNPTILENNKQDIEFNWNHIQNASYYSIRFGKESNEEGEYWKPVYKVDDTGSGIQRYVISSDLFDINYNLYYYVAISAFDEFGNSYGSNTYYFFLSTGDVVYINGLAEQTWNDVTDFATSTDFVIASNGSWTASTSTSWIMLANTTGVKGDSLNVSLTKNTGKARSGVIIVTCGSAVGTLTVNQCASIPDYPYLQTPVLSDDPNNPTLFNDMTELTVTWLSEPQADYHKIEIDKPENGYLSQFSTVRESEKLRGKDTYTFKNLKLEAGQLYRLEFFRGRYVENNKYTLTARAYYFSIIPGNSFIEVNKSNLEVDGDWNGEVVQVKSSGTWTVTSNESWLLVGSSRVKDIENPDDYYNVYSGNSGNSFYLSVLPNDSGSTRVGYVTITTAGSSISIRVEQEQKYVKPEILSPKLTSAGSGATDTTMLSYGDIELTWSAGESNTGIYSLTLYEQKNNSSSYSQTWAQTGISKLTYTIPRTVLKESTGYKLKLSTELQNNGGTVSKIYYFRTKNSNELALSASVNWDAVETGGYVTIKASASGGDGVYKYWHELIHDGISEAMTDLGPYTSYAFLPAGTGTYKVRVGVQDGSGEKDEFVSEYKKEQTNMISLNGYSGYHVTEEIDQSYHLLKYKLFSDDSWTVKETAEWLIPSDYSGNGNTDITIKVEQNNTIKRVGKIVFRNDRTGATADLTVTQNSDISIVVSDEGTLITEKPQNVYISFSSTEDWKIASDSSWAVPSKKNGEAGTKTIFVGVTENTGEEERTATITLSAGGQRVAYKIRQVGTNAEGSIGISAYTWQIDTPYADILSLIVSTAGSWNITSCPDWIRSTVQSGEGSTTLSLYAEGNTEKGVRQGKVIFTGSGKDCILQVAQSGIDVAATVVDFDISQKIVGTGEDVTFTIQTKMADQVQLIVDGVAYEEYNVYGDKVTIVRAFSKAGDRIIRLLPKRNGVEGIVSSDRKLIVTSMGTLMEPLVSGVEDILLGAGVTVYWSAVPNADTYTIYLGNEKKYEKLNEVDAQTTSLTISADELSEAGQYKILVVASGVGYSQSQGSVEFRVIEPVVDFTIVSPHNEDGFETNDIVYLQLNNPSNYYIRFEVSHDDQVWYVPADGPVNDSYIDLQYVIPEMTGEYQVRARAYATASQGATEFWNPTEPDPVTFDVVGGMIKNLWIGGISLEYLNKGNKVTNTSNFGVGSLGIITNMSIERIDVIRDGTLLDTLTKEDGEFQDYSYKYSIDETGQVSEGEHTYKVVAYDKNNQEIVYGPYTLYVYTPLTPNTVKYPHDSSTPLLRFPNSSTGNKLKLNETITVRGTYGSYYFVRREDGSVGFVNQSKLYSEKYIDWNAIGLTVNTWSGQLEANMGNQYYIMDQPYNISISWMLTDDLPNNAYYNVYLDVSKSAAANQQYLKTIQVGSGIKDNSITINSDQFRNLFVDESQVSTANVFIRVDVLDASNTVKKSARSDTRVVDYSNGTVAKELIRNAVDRVLFNHDYIINGEGTLNGVTHDGGTPLKTIVKYGKWESALVGNDKVCILLDPVAQGAMLADTIIKDVSSQKAIKFELDKSKMYQLFEMIGLDVDLLEELLQESTDIARMEYEIEKTWAEYDPKDYFSEPGSKDEYVGLFNKWFTLYNEHADVAKIQSVFKFAEKMMTVSKTIVNVISDYTLYSSVEYSDVEKYIKLFNDSGVFALECAAFDLYCMTHDDTSRISYIGTSYGLKKYLSASALFKLGYEAAEKMVPTEIKYAIKIGRAISNFGFNTDDMLNAAYELFVVSEILERYKPGLSTELERCKEGPVQYYDSLSDALEAFMILFRIEQIKVGKLTEEAQVGAWHEFWRTMKGEEKMEYDGKEIADLCQSSIDSSLELFNAIWVLPYKN